MGTALAHRIVVLPREVCVPSVVTLKRWSYCLSSLVFWPPPSPGSLVSLPPQLLDTRSSPQLTPCTSSAPSSTLPCCCSGPPATSTTTGEARGHRSSPDSSTTSSPTLSPPWTGSRRTTGAAFWRIS